MRFIQVYIGFIGLTKVYIVHIGFTGFRGLGFPLNQKHPQRYSAYALRRAPLSRGLMERSAQRNLCSQTLRRIRWLSAALNPKPYTLNPKPVNP